MPQIEGSWRVSEDIDKNPIYLFYEGLIYFIGGVGMPLAL